MLNYSFFNFKSSIYSLIKSTKANLNHTKPGFAMLDYACLVPKPYKSVNISINALQYFIKTYLFKLFRAWDEIEQNVLTMLFHHHSVT